MEMWSRMFVVNVQSVSLQHLNWKVIKWCIQKSDGFAVVYVMQCSSVRTRLWHTLRDVLVLVAYLNDLQIPNVCTHFWRFASDEWLMFVHLITLRPTESFAWSCDSDQEMFSSLRLCRIICRYLMYIQLWHFISGEQFIYIDYQEVD